MDNLCLQMHFSIICAVPSYNSRSAKIVIRVEIYLCLHGIIGRLIKYMKFVGSSRVYYCGA